MLIIEPSKYKDLLHIFWAGILYHQIKDKDGNFYGIRFFRKHRDYAEKWIHETEPTDSIIKLFARKKCVYCGIDLKFTGSIGDHIVGKKLNGAQWRVPCCTACNSSKGNLDLIDWWVGKKNKDVLDIDKHVWAIYVRAKILLLKQENNYDQICSNPFLVAFDDLEVRASISDY